MSGRGDETMRTTEDLRALLDELFTIKGDYIRLAFHEEHWMERGEPATAESLLALEKRIGKPIPPSYRAFLELHDGWKHFSGGVHLLSVEDQSSDWVREWLGMLDMAFVAIKEPNPFEHGAVPIALGEGEHSFLLLDPSSSRSDGEMNFVAYYFGEIQDTFEDFTSYLLRDMEIEKCCHAGKKRVGYTRPVWPRRHGNSQNDT